MHSIQQSVCLKEVDMIDSDFFQEVKHTLVPWLGYHLHVPVFYHDIRFISASYLAPLEKVRKLLPSSRLHPFPVMPGRAAVSITAYQYLESDLGPYNEVIFSIPVSIDRSMPQFTGSLRKSPSPVITFIHTIPVTTEIARKVGLEFAGYPKFIAEIEFEEDENWVTCHLSLQENLILRLKGRKLSCGQTPRLRVSPLTCKEGYLLRSEFVISGREMGFSRRKEDVVLTLGDDPIADPLKSLNLKSASSYGYCPHAKGILTPVFESFSM
jgi:hypothetical protein